MANPVVLIVEDEALIRISARHMLEDAGFSVVEACDADEAIEILARQNDVGAVFTDINMKGSMDGLKLAHAIRDRWPPIHLIVASGPNVPREDQLPANARFIHKPYAAKHVVAVLHEFFARKLPSFSGKDNHGGAEAYVAS